MNEELSGCPVCGEPKSELFLEIPDYFLSKEQFRIFQCTSCGFRYVNPRPVEHEIGRYYQSDAYISHDASKKDFLSRIYKIARNVSIRNKYKLVHKYCQQGSILDFGCGTGEFLAYCKGKGYITTGFEPGEKAREFAVGQNGIHVLDNIVTLGKQTSEYNCITLWHVLEHVHNLNDTIELLSQLLSSNGVLIIAVPNCNSGDARKYGKFWAAYDVPRHLYHFTSTTLTNLFNRHRFAVLEILPQKMDAYYVSMLSEKYRTGRNNYLNAVINGFLSNFHAKETGLGFSSQIYVLKRDNA
jgi:2-polyprenyl-3-methyl-5-hydroxy-6-metoxy-1,4-benzoquinol methylase